MIYIVGLQDYYTDLFIILDGYTWTKQSPRKIIEDDSKLKLISGISEYVLWQSMKQFLHWMKTYFCNIWNARLMVTAEAKSNSDKNVQCNNISSFNIVKKRYTNRKLLVFYLVIIKFSVQTIELSRIIHNSEPIGF